MSYKIGEVIEDFKSGEKLEVLELKKSEENNSVYMKLRNINTNEIKEIDGYLGKLIGQEIR